MKNVWIAAAMALALAACSQEAKQETKEAAQAVASDAAGATSAAASAAADAVQNAKEAAASAAGTVTSGAQDAAKDAADAAKDAADVAKDAADDAVAAAKNAAQAIGALDYLRNRLMNPDADNLTETDDLMAQKAALSANISTDEARQALINDAVKRRTAQINYTQQLTDNLNQQSKDMGLPYAPESSVNVQALSPEQRLQSYIKGSNADPELAFDLENRSVDYLEAKYGSTVANYASQLATQTAANLSRATSILPEEARKK